MANKDFVVKNGIVVNTYFSANSTFLNFSNVVISNTTSATFRVNVSNGFFVNTQGNASFLSVNNNISIQSNNHLSLTVGNTANLNITSNLTVNTTTTTINANLTTINANLTTINANLVVTGSLRANGSLGSAGQILASNASGIYWVDFSGALNPNNTSSDTHYIATTNVSSGIWSSPVISTTKLYFVPSTGTLTATDFNSLSDENMKNNIKDIKDPIETIKTLRGVSFNWVDNNKPSYGVIAQEVEKFLPELVSVGENGIKTVNYDGFIAFLIESIKILEKKIQNLEKNK